MVNEKHSFLLRRVRGFTKIRYPLLPIAQMSGGTYSVLLGWSDQVCWSKLFQVLLRSALCCLTGLFANWVLPQNGVATLEDAQLARPMEAWLRARCVMIFAVANGSSVFLKI